MSTKLGNPFGRQFQEALQHFKAQLKILKTYLKITDYSRWAAVKQEAGPWSERNYLIASLIPSGSTVIDLGAGAQTLRQYLNNCSYQPCDLIQLTPDTIVCDFNANQYPNVKDKYDYVVCSGLFEYIRQPEEFLRNISKIGHNIILSYAVTLPHRSRQWRLTMGWFNHFSKEELESLFNSVGFQYEVCNEWSEQVIYHIKTP